MLEIARILAGGSVVLLIVSFTAWAASLGRPLFARLDGAASATAHYHHTAALLLLTAVVTGSVAAFLAIADFAT